MQKRSGRLPAIPVRFDIRPPPILEKCANARPIKPKKRYFLRTIYIAARRRCRPMAESGWLAESVRQPTSGL
jgi:hypothetical protein